MNDGGIDIHAPGIDTAELVKNLRETVEEKMLRGDFRDPIVTRAERANLANLKDEDELLSFYMESLHDIVSVDITDFEIQERRSLLRRPLVALKKLLWKLLRFYTYRLWSQQNLINGLLTSAIENTEKRNRKKIAEMEDRIKELEKRSK